MAESLVERLRLRYNKGSILTERLGEPMEERSFQARFAAARRAAIATEFAHLNPQQREGVLTTEGPLLLLAGAGSGKTTVLINRIANLLRFGRGADTEDVPETVTEDDLHFLEHYPGAAFAEPDEAVRMERLCRIQPARPWEILAITFTNKAAGELRTRLEQQVGAAGLDVWAATFHSACVRILRREIEVLGFPASFTIYDTDDSLRVIKACVKEFGLDEKVFAPRTVLNYISRAKDECLLAADFAERAQMGNDLRQKKIATLYGMYQDRLWKAGALDFDDIILHTVRILQQYPKLRDYYQNKFRYVLVDEYQDTNHLQYLLTSLLAAGHKNICVVGDDDQSIYRFRGATIENILSFEQEYQATRVIRLEQNYRSSGHILEASNAVIEHNDGRKGKKLWTEQGKGEKVQLFQAMNEQDEALQVAADILKGFADGTNFRECAVLYRMNAQSNQLEMAFKRNSIPYKVVGGMRFFERAEIKDMLAYLCVLHNPEDDLRLLRIINTPTRGIGAKAIEALQLTAQEASVSLWDVLLQVEAYPHLARLLPKLRPFVDMLVGLRGALDLTPLPDLYDRLLQESGYLAMLQEKKDENATRIENVRELKTSVSAYLENALEPSLAGFLDEVALYTDLDSLEDTDNCVTMMTIHAAKGLEFAHVFVVGMEEGLFPGFRAIGERDELEEERRLCYVAMTRAKKVLHLSCAAQRMLFGKTSANMPSRFVKEIPPELLDGSGRDALFPNDLPFETQWERPQRENSVPPIQSPGITTPGGIPPVRPIAHHAQMPRCQASQKGIWFSIPRLDRACCCPFSPWGETHSLRWRSIKWERSV